MNVNAIKPLLLIALLASCRTSYHPAAQTYQRVTVDAAIPADSGMARFLQPYKAGLDRNMNEVLIQSAARLDKAKPESALGNLLTDALLQEASRRYGKNIDLAHLNYGGIRNSLPNGPITTGSVFEVMPFDNAVTVLTLSGKQLQQFLEHFAAHDEALVVSGVRVKLSGKQLQSVTFNNGRALVPDQTYTVAMSDYIANGGGNAAFLKDALKREDLNYLIRDAFLDYFRQAGKAGKTIQPTTDGRIATE